jgi:Sec-independent protein translocase protein TatA
LGRRQRIIVLVLKQTRHPQAGRDPNTFYSKRRTVGVPRFGAPTSQPEKEIQMLGEIFGIDGMIVLVVLIALLFGGAAIPKLARSLGSAKNEFEAGLDAGKRGSSLSIADGSVAAPPTVARQSTSTR